jgi:hypothetical protein
VALILWCVVNDAHRMTLVARVIWDWAGDGLCTSKAILSTVFFSGHSFVSFVRIYAIMWLSEVVDTYQKAFTFRAIYTVRMYYIQKSDSVIYSQIQLHMNCKIVTSIIYCNIYN